MSKKRDIEAQSQRQDRLSCLLLLPTGRDLDMVQETCTRHGIATTPCRSPAELLDHIKAACGPVVLSDEALGAPDWETLDAWFDMEPRWSELPVILLTRRWSRPHLGGRVTARRSTTILCRPVTTLTLVSAITTALDSRRRQLEVRDLLDELRNANRKLDLRAEQLQRLALALSQAEESERRRVAGILHDGLQQLLAAARVTLKLAAAPRKEQHDRNRALARVDAILEEAIQSARKLSHELSPPSLAIAGLGPSLEQLAESIRTTYRLSVTVTWSEDTRDLDVNLAAFLYSAAGELLFNVHKHAQTQSARIVLEAEDGHISLTVADEGCGFSPDELRETPANYLGLGLFAIRERIELLGGAFHLHSEPGHGTQITLSVPRKLALNRTDAEHRAPHEPEPHTDPAERALRVVIADDHRVMRNGLVSLLNDVDGIDVVAEAGDGQEALETARALRPDVVVMDVSMPRLNGIEATRQLLAELPNTQVIGLSMLDRPEIAEEMLGAGASAFLLKTGPTDSLVASILACRIDTSDTRTPES